MNFVLSDLNKNLNYNKNIHASKEFLILRPLKYSETTCFSKGHFPLFYHGLVFPDAQMI